MSLQFALGHNDQKVVEDFLCRQPAATTAIVLDAKAAPKQRHAADVASVEGIRVLWEPATQLLAAPGYGLDRFPLWAGAPYEIDLLATSLDARRILVERTIEAHPLGTTEVTAPHFYVASDRVAHLNVDLAEATALQADRPVRVILTASQRYLRSRATALAEQYREAGICHLELRMSPFGGEDESLKKITDGFRISKEFTDAGLHVTLGYSGNLGQVAVALGHAAAYSVGVGMMEHVDHKTQVNRKSKPPRPREDGESGGGPQAGVYLPALAYTAPPKVAKRLMEQSDLRVRIGCRVGRCGTSVLGPILDVREHYLHSRDREVAALMAQPVGWRPTAELERLRKALILRDRINRTYLAPGQPPIKTRTLDGLIEDIERVQAASLPLSLTAF
jgi:hypothetical protein